MGTKTIFISCGQDEETEIKAGERVRAVVNADPGLEAFFAEHGGKGEGLFGRILDALKGCSGAVFVVHGRGPIDTSDERNMRASVWISQELAILAYRRHALHQDVPILLFLDDNVSREGILGHLSLQPHSLPNLDEMEKVLVQWLREEIFQESVASIVAEKFAQTSDEDRMLLLALIQEGGVNVPRSPLGSIVQEKWSKGKIKAGEIVRAGFTNCNVLGLIDLDEKIPGQLLATIKPAFRDDLIPLVNEWERTAR